MLTDYHAPEGAMDDLRAGRFGFSVSVEPGEECEVFVTRGISFDQEQRKSNRLPEEVLDVMLTLYHIREMAWTGRSSPLLRG